MCGLELDRLCRRRCGRRLCEARTEVVVNAGSRGCRGLELGRGGVRLGRNETESLYEFVSGVFEDIAIAVSSCATIPC